MPIFEFVFVVSVPKQLIRILRKYDGNGNVNTNLILIIPLLTFLKESISRISTSELLNSESF